MPTYEYRCITCATTIESNERSDKLECGSGHLAVRIFASVNINAASARHKGRWDPVVGAYVESDRQFRSLLAQGVQEQSEKLDMDVKIATVDARDNEGLAELHGYTTDQRAEDLEGEKKAKHDAQAT